MQVRVVPRLSAKRPGKVRSPLGSPERAAESAAAVAASQPPDPPTWILFRRFVPLKRVILSDTSLHVSNFLREVVVPLRDVESVNQREGTESLVIVRFARRTAFGRRIVFSGIGWKPPQPHPIVAELRAVVTAAKATSSARDGQAGPSPSSRWSPDRARRGAPRC